MIVAIIGDFVVPYVLANFYKSYNHNLMVMSLLGNPKSPVRSIYNVWLIILGVLLIISSIAVVFKYWEVSPLLHYPLLF